ncbi:MAG: hypothetical protein HQM14_06125 [SAR324 cluster bacterium]|nr:hypothetical protein [SAR324 cluster bacterium]
MAPSQLKHKRKQKKAKDSSWIYIIAPLLVLLGGVLMLGYITFTSDNLRDKEDPAANQWAVEYWRTPIPDQGNPPPEFHLLAQRVEAKNCKGCHVDKFAEWSSSLHSHAMGPGVYGQYFHFNESSKAECNICHAPMSEQWEDTLDVNKNWEQNPEFNKVLFEEGVTCAACHLRQHQRNAPPLRPGKESLSQALHGEPVRTPFFQASEFCKGCHQHKPDTLKIGGNTIENTYIEWLESPAYEQGRTCQSCHMPDRKHLWKGIHDKEMTASGVTINHSVSSNTPKSGSSFSATLTIKNTGTGHMFPTYTTPAVFLKAAFLNKQGQAIPNFYEEKIIQRRLDMSTNPWTEFFDTRLAPNESLTLEFHKTVPPEAASFQLWIWVEPDEFYEGFFRTTLKNSQTHEGRAQLEDALQTTLDRQYPLFSKTLSVAADAN